MINDLISRQAAIDAVAFGITYAKAFDKETGEVRELFVQGNYELRKAVDRIKELPSTDAVDVVRCKECKHQEKFFHADRRRKGGGYYIYGCELAEGYSHVCLDDDFCSRAERRRA